MRPWWLRLARFAPRHARGLLAIVLLTLGGVALAALKPWPLKLLVDHVLTSRPLPQGMGWLADLPGGGSAAALVGWLAAATVLIFALHWTAQAVQAYVQSGVGSRLTYDLGGTLFDRLQRLSPAWHSRQAAGDLVRRVTKDSACVRQFVMEVCLPALTSLASLAVMFVIMWQLDPWLTVIAMGVVAPLGVVHKLFFGPMTERTYEQQQLEGEMLALAEQTLTALPAVQAFGREPHEDARFRGLTVRTLRAYLRALRSQLAFKFGVDGVVAVGGAAIMVLGGYHVLSGTLTIGGLLVFLAYLTSLYELLAALAHLTSGFAAAAAGATRVHDVLDAGEAIREAPGARPLPALATGRRGHVRLEHVTFGYHAERPVLKDVSLEARPGETIALVGPTGAGKTTLVSLIPRFFDPWEGRVVIDGADVREVQLSSLRSNIALVLQEPLLLPLSIAGNIAYGRPEASRAEIEAAAVAARAHDFIVRLPQGYDTVVGERGATLSVGERQRLSIARALCKDAPIVILDEPTSALDTATEAELLDAMSRLARGRTTFIIAHRLSTIRRADRVLVLDAGRVVESGSRREPA